MIAIFVTYHICTVVIYFYRFPKDPLLRQRWVDALRRENFSPSIWAVVFSAYFLAKDIDRTSISSVRVRKNAVPTVFPAFPCYLKETKSRKPSKLRSS